MISTTGSWFGVVFFLGAIVQAFFLLLRSIINKKKDKAFNWLPLGGILFFVVLYFLLVLLGGGNLLDIIFVSTIIFTILFSSLYRKDILIVVNEQKLLQLNLVIVYLMYLLFASVGGLVTSSLLFVTFVIVFTGTIGTIIISYTHITLTLFWKAAFYAWFAFMNLIIIVFQAKNYIIPFLFQGAAIDYFNLFVLGAVFMLLTFNLLLILEFLPIPARGQKMRDRIKDIKKHASMLGSKYSDVQLSWKTATLIILVYVCIFGLNSWFKLMDKFLLINLLLLFVFYYDYLMQSRT